MRKIAIAFLLFYSFPVLCQDLAVKRVFENMLSAASSIQNTKFILFTEERLLNGKYALAERIVKVQSTPLQIYFFAVKPDAGMEVLRKVGWNENKMLIHPGGFPYLTFSLNTNSALARKDSHHPIEHIGFDYLAGLMKFYLDKFKNHFYDYATISDTVVWDNRKCIVLEFDFKDYKKVNYTMRPGENITSISEQIHVNDYSLLIMNPFLDGFEKAKTSRSIKVPNFYNRKFIFYIDKNNWLPIKQLIYDEAGLYENYEMKSLLINPVFEKNEFDENNPAYSF